MELEPTTECGKLLYSQLKNWISSSPDSAKDALHRLFIMYASKIENQDTFVDALYGKRVLDREQHGELQSSPAALLSRVRQAISASTSNNDLRLKELVVALEWSKNETVLAEFLKWAEETGSKEITAATNARSTIDLAPERAAKTFASMQRRRELLRHAGYKTGTHL